MKFNAALSSLLVLLPFILSEVTAVPANLNTHNQGEVQPNKFTPPPPPQKAVPPPPPKKATPPPPPPKAAPPPPAAKGNGGAAAASSSAAAAAASSSAAAAAASSSAAAAAASSSAAAAAAAASSPAAAAAASSSAAAAASASSSAAAAAATSAANGNSTNAQTSLCLDPSQVQPGLEQDGQAIQEAGQVASLTSGNNFINFCLTVPNFPLTNGQQVVTGSCNPTIMGQIIPKASMPSCKFVSPINFETIASNTSIAFKLAVNNMETGNFVNAQTNYFAAPQQLNAQNILVAHSHITVNAISSFQDTQPLDPQVFSFFKGLNAPAVNGILEADAAQGLPAGFYRACSINTAANHQPALVAVAQHASLDDCIYFQVSDNPGNGGVAAASSSAAAAATTTAAGATSSAAAAATSSAAAATSSVLAQQGSTGGAVRNKQPSFRAPNRGNQNQNQRFGQQNNGGRGRFNFGNGRNGRGRGRGRF